MTLMTLPIAEANRNTVSIGKVLYEGTICPEGSTNVSFTQKNIINIEFNQAQIQSKSRNKHNILKRCVVKVPIKVPHNMSVAIESAKYTGNHSLAPLSTARLMTVFNFANKKSNRTYIDLNALDKKNYSFEDPLDNLSTSWSSCGQDIVILITTSIRLKNKQNIFSSIGSHSAISTKIKYRNCQNN